MFWNKKEEKKALPDLPPLQSPFNKDLSSLPEQDEDLQMTEKHALPSFPDSPLNKGFSQAVIKDAVGSPTAKDDLETAGSQLPPPKEFKTIEMEETKASSPSIASMQKSISQQISQSPEEKENLFSQTLETKTSFPLGPPPIQPAKPIPTPTLQLPTSPQPLFRPTSKNQDIFVKIEKFQGARRALQTTRDHLEQIESILKKIRETKLKEEQELATWEKDLALAKSRVQEVTENIFEKLD
jgi:hypothetical protein